MKREFWLALCFCICSAPLRAELPQLTDKEPAVELVGQELDPAFLENLPAPVEAPAQVHLRTVIEKDQWLGSQCGITLPTQAVFRTTASWEKFWNLALLPYNRKMPPVPAIDFEKEMVIGVFMGSKDNPGYQITIKDQRIEARGDQQELHVKYKNESKMQSVFTPPFTVQPFHLKKIPIFMGLTAFKEVR